MNTAKKIQYIVYVKLSVVVGLKPNWFSDSDASAFANAEASLKIKIRKPFHVMYTTHRLPLTTSQSLFINQFY